MSLVGPRPEVARYADHWTPEQRAVILSVRPGITDPVTVELRREEEILRAVRDPESYYITTLLPDKATRYMEYVENRSLRSDVMVVAHTLWAIVRH
jgi:lipopolysaccharide/colanic/teichoic acid biosynthesis glycosyltransferase